MRKGFDVILKDFELEERFPYTSPLSIAIQAAYVIAVGIPQNTLNISMSVPTYVKSYQFIMSKSSKNMTGTSLRSRDQWT